jgi:hypothetical protein
MSQLASFLNALRDDSRVASYSELQLKQAVILRVLHLLGWDTFDVSKVQADHQAGGVTVDYALQTPSNGMIFLHIIKPMSDATREEQDKIVKLAGAENVRIAVLTDGVHWEMFAPTVRGTLNEKEFAKFSLTEHSPEEIEHQLKYFLAHRIAVSGTAFQRAEKICHERLKKKNTNLSTALSDAWSSAIQEFEEIFVELIAVEAKRRFGTEASPEAVARFFSRFVGMTTGEAAQAKRAKYSLGDEHLFDAWTSLFQQLEPLFIELMALDIEQSQNFIPEKESIAAYLHKLQAMHEQAIQNTKKLKTA